jgi:hypothetical protein
MIRKLVACLALVGMALLGMLVFGGTGVASARDGTDAAASTGAGRAEGPAPGCAWAGRLLSHLDKVQERGTALLAWLEAKQPELAQGNPEVGARIGTAITAIRTRLAELNEQVPALRARITERCPTAS